MIAGTTRGKWQQKEMKAKKKKKKKQKTKKTEWKKKSI